MNKIGTITSELFNISFITYLCLLLIETFNKGYVSNVFNMNYLLAIVIISGIFKLLPIAEKKLLSQWDIIDSKFISLRSQLNLPKSFTENELYFILLVSLTGGTLVYFKTEELGKISITIAIVTTLILILLSYLIFTDKKNE